MWTPENIAALCTGIAGIIGSVVVLIRQIQHANSTAAHASVVKDRPQDAGNRD